MKLAKNLFVLLLVLFLCGCASIDVLYQGERKAKQEVAILKHIHKYGQIDCAINSIDGITKSNQMVKKLTGQDQTVWSNKSYTIELLPGDHTITTYPQKTGYIISGDKYNEIKFYFEAGKTYCIKYIDLQEVVIEEMKDKK